MFFIAFSSFQKVGTISDSNSSTLYLLTLFPYPDLVGDRQPSFAGGPGVVPAMQLAVDLLNNRTDILPDYQLELIHGDSGCNITSRTYVSFVRGISMNERSPVGIIGPICSRASLVTSPLSGRDEISLIDVHLSGTHLLGNRTNYPNSFGLLGSGRTLVNTTFALMNRKSWRRIAALFDESRVFYSSTFQELKRNIKTTIPNGEIVFASAVYSTNFPLQVIKDSLIRIITVFTGAELARRIMCLAYHENMLYPAYQWILYVRRIRDFDRDVEFVYSNINYKCSGHTMVNVALRGSLLIDYRYSQLNTSLTTISGLSYDEYLPLYQERISQYNKDPSNLYANMSRMRTWANLAFDAVWALALGLNNSGLDLTQYRFGKSEMTDIIRKQFYQLNFQGISGAIKFDQSTGFITRVASIFQVYKGRELLIAHDDAGEFQDFASAKFISDTFETTNTTVKPAVAAILAALTMTLFGLIVAAHVITVVRRKDHSLKASSPKLNNLIYIGCYILICGILLFEIHQAIPELSDEVTGICCQAFWGWLIPISATLILGAIAARTWRLYRLFTHWFKPGNLISDPILFAFVVFLLICDVVIGILWTAVDPLRVQITQTTVTTGPDKGFVILLRRRCTANYYFVWFACLYGFHALLLTAVTILSLLTHKIEKKYYTTNSQRVLVYLLSLLISLGTLLYSILVFQDVDIHLDYSVLCIVLNTAVFLCFAFVFLPPIIPLLKEKRQSISSGRSQHTNV